MAHDSLSWLQDWYLSQCNGDWEHQQGVEIGTLDNPGWSMDVDLMETPLEGIAFEKIAIERSSRDWFSCEVTKSRFKAACGPRNLAEVIETFRAWAVAHTPNA